MIKDYFFIFGNEFLNNKTLLCDQFEKKSGEVAGGKNLSLIELSVMGCLIQVSTLNEKKHRKK